MTYPTGQQPNPDPGAANGTPQQPQAPYQGPPAPAGAPYSPQSPAPYAQQAPAPYGQQPAAPQQPAAQQPPAPYGAQPAVPQQPAPYGQQPTAPQPTAPQPAVYPAAPGQPGQYAPQGHVPPAAPRPTTNPFKGVPTSDLVRDGLAALLFLISLALPWNAFTWSSDYQSRTLIEVLLVVLLSALAVGLPYLGRAGILGPVWSAAKSRSIRLLIPAPYVLLVVIHVIVGAVTEPKAVLWGSSVMFGLAASALVATPHRYELDAATAKAEVAKWKQIVYIVLGVAGVAILASAVWALIDHADFFADKALLLVVLAIVTLLVTAAIAFGAGVAALIFESTVWRKAFVAFGVVLLVFTFFGLDDDSRLPRVELVNPSPIVILLAPMPLGWGFGFFLIPAIAAILASPAFALAEDDSKPGESWIRSAGVLLWVGSGLSILVILNSISILVLGNYDGLTSTAKIVTALVLGLLSAGATGYAGLRLWMLAPDSRLMGFAGIGTAFILGIVQLSIAPEYFTGRLVTFGHLALAFGIPIAAALALLMTKAARDDLARLSATRPAPQAVAYAGAPGYQAQPAPGYPAQPAPYQQAAQQPYDPAGTPPQQAAQQPYNSAGTPPQAAPYQPAGTPGAPATGATPAYQVPMTGATPLTSAGSGATPVAPVPNEAPVTGATPVAAVTTGATPVAASQPDSAAPATPSAPAAAPASHGFTAAQASDPATDQHVLAEIVQQAPELRVQVAGNPSTYPALVDWLKLLGDPAIDAAIANRND